LTKRDSNRKKGLFVSAEPELTQLIAHAASGDPDARAQLYQRAYPELHRLAHSRLYRHGGNESLQTTEVLSESFMRFVGSGAMRAQDRAQFFALASNIMRSVIFDTVRAAHAEKRGSGEVTVLSTQIAESVGIEVDRFLEVEDAMARLEKADPRLAQVVDMRYFGGMGWEEIAEAMGVNARTARRDWEKAQLLLRAMLT
jgi:RNA polymerase sigma factor (TIGR02999 family)